LRSFTNTLAFAGILLLSSIGITFAQSVDGGDNALAVSASAQPTPDASKPTKKKGPADAWHGFYAGIYGAADMRRATGDTSTVFSSTGYFNVTSVPGINGSGRQALNSTGFGGGITAGYNRRSGDWLVGAETDLGILRGTGSGTTTTTYPCCSPSTFTITQSATSSWLFTARPRVGYFWHNTMVYLTGGLAAAHIKYAETFADTFANAAESGDLRKTVIGWTGGGGVEKGLNARWSAKAEFLYAQFARQSTTSTNLTAFAAPIAFPQNVFTHSIFDKERIFRLGINYHF
jgi:outer membrane immunogenic protein